MVKTLSSHGESGEAQKSGLFAASWSRLDLGFLREFPITLNSWPLPQLIKPTSLTTHPFFKLPYYLCLNIHYNNLNPLDIAAKEIAASFTFDSLHGKVNFGRLSLLCRGDKSCSCPTSFFSYATLHLVTYPVQKAQSRKGNCLLASYGLLPLRLLSPGLILIYQHYLPA